MKLIALSTDGNEGSVVLMRLLGAMMLGAPVAQTEEAEAPRQALPAPQSEDQARLASQE